MEKLQNINTNDARILELQSKIEAQRATIGTIPKFNPSTNCSLTIMNNTYNLNVTSISDLKILQFLISQTFNDGDRIGNYEVNVWLQDIHDLLGVKFAQEKKAKLDKLELQLLEVLSNDAKAAKMIDAIEKMI